MSPSLLLQPESRTEPPKSSSETLESVLSDPTAMRQFRKGGLLGLGEAYMDGRWESDHLDQFMFDRFKESGTRLSASTRAKMLMAAVLPRLFDRQSGAGAFRIGRFHYDLGNDLFETMLDRSLTYTSGYWAEADDLDAAQEAKLELLCRKLDLQPGMRVLDIGCGWGNFAHHAASRHGVEVTGITVSVEQADVARDRCSGLPVDIRIQDYRDLSESFDRIASIEMIEAVGHEYLPGYFSKISQLLVPDGAALIQGITMPDHRYGQYLREVDYIRTRVFPGSCVPSASAMIAAAVKRSDLRPAALHDFGHHYARTLREWRLRFKENEKAIRALGYDDSFRRAWEYYLCYCEAGFEEGYTGDVHLLLAKPACKLARGFPE